jgi:rod shape-determining protein MreD
MRSATLVLTAYALMLVTAVVWSALPIPVLGDAPPDIAALTAGYLGLTARRGVAGAVGAAVVTGYLADLLSGSPHGLLAIVAGLISLGAIGIQRRILVRGWALTAGFAFAASVIAALLTLLIRAVAREPMAHVGTELWAGARVAIATGILGPLALRLYRRVDAGFARTHREREHALEGLAP